MGVLLACAEEAKCSTGKEQPAKVSNCCCWLFYLSFLFWSLFVFVFFEKEIRLV